VLGGYITDNASWPWIFYVNLPVGILGIYMTFRNVIEPADVLAANRARAEVAKKNLDIVGLVLMTVMIAAMMYVFEEGSSEDWFESTKIQIATFVAVIGGAAFTNR
jgi:DHA2 family multidrug resistance protein